jgi:hypothetical protein
LDPRVGVKAYDLNHSCSWFALHTPAFVPAAAKVWARTFHYAFAIIPDFDSLKTTLLLLLLLIVINCFKNFPLLI